MGLGSGFGNLEMHQIIMNSIANALNNINRERKNEFRGPCVTFFAKI